MERTADVIYSTFLFKELSYINRKIAKGSITFINNEKSFSSCRKLDPPIPFPTIPRKARKIMINIQTEKNDLSLSKEFI
jgi:hypothetical protein